MHIISACTYLTVMVHVYLDFFHVCLCGSFTCGNLLPYGYATVLSVWLVPIVFYVQFLQEVATLKQRFYSALL